MHLGVGRFNVIVGQDCFTIERDQKSLTLPSGLGSEATKAVRLAMGLMDFKVLPPEIKFSPFTIKCSKEGFTLCHEGGECFFEDSEGDDLVQAIQMGTEKVTDGIQISGTRKGVRSFNIPDPVI